MGTTPHGWHLSRQDNPKGEAQVIRLHCSECGEGAYVNVMAEDVWHCTNLECDHVVMGHDVMRHLDEGETLTTDGEGYLAYQPTD